MYTLYHRIVLFFIHMVSFMLTLNMVSSVKARRSLIDISCSDLKVLIDIGCSDLKVLIDIGCSDLKVLKCTFCRNGGNIWTKKFCWQ